MQNKYIVARKCYSVKAIAKMLNKCEKRCSQCADCYTKKFTEIVVKAH